MKSLKNIQYGFYFLLGLGLPTWLGFLSGAMPEIQGLMLLFLGLATISIIVYVIFDFAKLKAMNADSAHFTMSAALGIIAFVVILCLFIYGFLLVN